MGFPALPILIPSILLSALTIGVVLTSPQTSRDTARAQAQPTERRSFCFAPNTPPELVAKYDAPAKATKVGASFLLSSTLNKALQISDRWVTTAINGSAQNSQGDPVTLTWSIAPDDTFINSGGVEGEVSSDSNLRSWLVGIYGGSATGPAADQPWFSIFQVAFDNLSSETGLTFLYEPNDDGATLSTTARGILGTRGDIRIAGHTLDGNNSVLAYNYFPDYGDMVIDTADGYYNNTSNSSIRLRNVLEHEFGHGLGLDHVCPINGTKLMEPNINLSFTGAQFDTIYSLQRNYGDPFEKLNSALNNDSFANATPLPLQADNSWNSDYLGIDDNTDTDYLSFPVTAGSTISATITPSDNSYLEGAQLTSGDCESGTTFDSSAQQDLTLNLYDQNQNLLATANTGGLGIPETLAPFTAVSTGTHYLRITGSGTNSNQIYSAEVSIAIPGISLQIASTTLTSELFSEQNGAPDPLETVEVEVTIENIGELDATNVQASLTPSDDLIAIADSATLGDVANGTETSFTLVFALDGDCGETINLPLELTFNNSETVTRTLSFTLGGTGNILAENFDSSNNLPTGWTSDSDGGSGWSLNSNASSAPNSIFAENLDSTGESILTSPLIGPVLADSTLSFTHSYNTETPYDGGVLEISLDGGTWEDILDAGGTFDSGGYNGTLTRRRNSNPLSNRPAWAGDSGGFINTTLTLPSDATGQTVQFRWRMGHDSTQSDEGWYLDDISLASILCDTSGPAITLTSTDLIASEFSATDTAQLLIETTLPVAEETTIAVTTSGTANGNTDLTGLADFAELADFTGLANLTIPALTQSTSATLTAISDSLAEGPETLVVTSADGLQSLSYTILDTPYGTWAFGNIADPFLREVTDDADGDLSPNIEEFLFATDPDQFGSRPNHQCAFIDGTLRLSYPLNSLPADLLVSAESSPDLTNWAPTFISAEEDEFILTPPSSPYFLRLTYELLQTAP